MERPPETARHRSSPFSRILPHLLPAFTLLVMAGCCLGFELSGAAELLLGGLRERFPGPILAGLIYIPLVLFGLLAIIYPVYWIEAYFMNAQGKDVPVWWPGTLRDIAVDLLVGTLILYVLTVLMVFVPYAWWILAGLAAGGYTLFHHLTGMETLIRRATSVEPHEDESFFALLEQPLTRLRANVVSCHLWLEQDIEVPIPSPGIVVCGHRQTLRVYIPATRFHTLSDTEVAREVIHTIAIAQTLSPRQTGLLHGLFAAALFLGASGLVHLYAGLTGTLPPGHLEAIPLFIGALCLLTPLLQILVNLRLHRLITAADAHAATAMGSPTHVARIIQRQRRTDQAPSRLPPLLETITQSHPLARTRIRRLKKARS